MRIKRSPGPCGLAFAALALSLSFRGGAVAQTACAQLVPTFEVSLRGSDLAAIVTVARRVLDEPSCDGATRNSVGRRAALAHLREIQRRGNDLSARQQLELLDAASRFGRPWQVLASLGDARQQVRGADGRVDYAAASAAYQAALNDLNDPQNVPNPPPNDVIQTIVRKARQTRMLADRNVALPAMRDGSPGGLALRSVRGVEVERVALPIHFVRDRAEMTPLGREAADEMWRMLDSMGRPRVRIVGHTDPDGSDDYNLQLSRRRAEAVAGFLREHGYDAQQIQTEGRGKREPLTIEDASQYSQDQIYQMQRRVEIVWR